CALSGSIGGCVFGRADLLRWGVLVIVGFLGALLIYEQAVVLALLLGLCLWSVSRGLPLRARLALPLLCLLLLLPYLAFYRTHIPTQTQYHQQRLKRFKTLPETTLHWLVPTGREVLTQIDVARVSPFNLLIPGFWVAWLALLAYLVALREGLRSRIGWLGWLGSLLAYAPLMPVLPLMHYYYLPAVFRALWAGILLVCLFTLRPTRRATSVALVIAVNTNANHKPRDGGVRA
ncbi:MAG: hypothetical protein P3X24_001535, partial [bacterium]|nr:hypothetical protein [bacterium]